jgi:hypothetical protein
MTSPALEQDDQGAYALLEEIVTSEGRLSADASERVRVAMRAYADGRGKRDLYDCFGWKPPQSGRSIPWQIAEAAYLAAFVDAWRAESDVSDCSNWRRCEYLVSHINDFELLDLPTWRRCGIPKNASRMKLAIYQIFNAVSRRPARTAKAIHEILKRARLLT